MEEEISFEDLGLDEITQAAVERKGFKNPSPIQVLAIPRLLNGDANIIAKARTGTGKTAAFGLPIMQNIREESDHVRALILEPTRELAVQTCTELRSFTTSQYPRVTVVYGGASMREQIHDLKRGVEIVVGTPGRIQDHIERGTLKLDKLDYFILDEGDEMLDMGFVDDIEAIFAKANPASRILLFSATMPAPILKIAQKFMGEYEICEEEGAVDEPLLIDQKYWVVRESDKVEALVRLIDIAPDFYGLVFTQTKNDADTVSRMLDERGYDVAALHGDIPQGQREKILARFRSRKTRILIATDVAARGIDISGLSHVVNYSLPFDGSTYVHRIGRTGRAGAAGCAVTFVRPEERRKLEYLKSAVRRASKGEMTEASVPSIEQVLEVKRTRILAELKSQISVEKAIPESVDTPDVDPKTDSENVTVTEDSGSQVLKTVAPLYEKMAEELCAGLDVKSVLAGVLAVSYGKTLDESYYGRISAQRSQSSAKQIRLYVQMGRRDGFNPREVASYFSSLLHIPGKMVDRIDVAENFCLLNLPVAAANQALELAKRDSSIPHMHIDSKSISEFGGGMANDGFRGRRDNSFGKRNGYRGGRYGVARGDSGSRRRGGSSRDAQRSGGFHSDHARPNVHTPTERFGASAYKKSYSKSEEY